MLVLLTPEFSGTDVELSVVAELTGLLAYDLRTRLCLGAYSVLRAIAEPQQAQDLAVALRTRGIEAVVVDSGVGQDPVRRVVYARGIELLADGVVLRLRERQMTIAYPALLCVVRGDVHMGRTPRVARVANTSGQHRAAQGASALRGKGVSDGSGPRDSRGAVPQEVFAAADLHFVTVTWMGRIDARDFEFPASVPASDSLADRLDWLVDEIAARSGIHVDRHVRISNLASHTAGARPSGGTASLGAVSQRSAMGSDEHFDAYSRLVAEAERRRRGGG
jgi:hypothetical protein